MSNKTYIPGDLTIIILFYKLELEGNGIYENTFNEIAGLIKGFSDPGVDNVISYTKHVIEMYLQPLRITPGLAKQFEPGIWKLQELVPELMKYDCYVYPNYGIPKAGGFAILVTDSKIFVNFPKRVSICFKLDPEGPPFWIILNSINAPETFHVDSDYKVRFDTPVERIVYIMVEWARKINKLIQYGFDIGKISKVTRFLWPDWNIDYDEFKDCYLPPGEFTDCIKKINGHA